MKNPQFQIAALVALLFLPLRVGDAAPLVPRCELVSLRTHYRDAKLVFSGQVLNMRSKGESVEIRFKVLRSWKDARDSEIVLNANPTDPETLNFIKGQRYLVFASMFQGKLFAGGCSGTTELESARGEIKQLEKWRRRR